MQEKDLYYPLKAYFEAMGYTVEGEVKNCDVLVKAGQDYMAIELKTELNLKLILQAVERQRLFEYVYIAIPVQKIKMRSKSYLQKLHLLKRLGIGVILVHTITGEVQCVAQPVELDRSLSQARAKRKKSQVIGEFEKRILKNNVGGVNKKPITTAFRQNCFQILVALQNGAMSAKEIEIEGLDHKAVYGILYRNTYGWFEKQGQGKYGISKLGEEILESEKEIIEALLIGISKQEKTKK